MNKSLTVTQQIRINADSSAIWDTLVNPEKIKAYLFGTQVKTDWQVGSPIIFEGDWEGQKFQDKGHVITFNVEQELTYDYWSGFSGMEDIPENYSLVTYTISENHNGHVLTVRQQGFSGEEAREHTDKNWAMLLEKVKELAEN